MSDILRFKALSISKTQFEKKYQVSLTDLQWKLLSQNSEKDWEENAVDEIRRLAFKSIRKSMSDLGFKVDLNGSDLTFKEKTN